MKDSVGTEFLEAENNKNEKICYGYMEHKPKRLLDFCKWREDIT